MCQLGVDIDQTSWKLKFLDLPNVMLDIKGIKTNYQLETITVELRDSERAKLTGIKNVRFHLKLV